MDARPTFAGVSNESEKEGHHRMQHSGWKVSVGGKERNAFIGSIAGDQLIPKLNFSLIDQLSCRPLKIGLFRVLATAPCLADHPRC